MKYLICLLLLAGCASNSQNAQERARCVKIMTKTEAGSGSCY